MTKRSDLELPELRRQIHELAKSENWAACARLCRCAIALTPCEPFYPWYQTRMILVKCLVNIAGGEEGTAKDEAIQVLKKTLAGVDSEKMSSEWSEVNRILGYAYDIRESGDRSANLRQAITYFLRSLERIPKETDPISWATIMAQIGRCYFDLEEYSEGEERKKNLREAIAASEKALEIFTADGSSENWQDARGTLLTAKMLLGNSWRREADTAGLPALEEAIGIFEELLILLGPECDPVQRADVHYSLGNAFSQRSEGKRSKNLDRAIVHLEESAQYYANADRPSKWAAINIGLGLACSERSELSENATGEDLLRAIDAYQCALDLLTDEQYPRARQQLREKIATVKNALAGLESVGS